MGRFLLPRPAGLVVVLLNRQRRRRVNAKRLRAVLEGAARELAVEGNSLRSEARFTRAKRSGGARAGAVQHPPEGEVSLVLTGDRSVRTLNARYRGKDKPTDVLSFPGPGGEVGLGDIVISVETAARNARELGRTLAQELDVLALHGFLHVLGYDHETDDGTMDRLERRLRRRLLRAS